MTARDLKYLVLVDDLFLLVFIKYTFTFSDILLY